MIRHGVVVVAGECDRRALSGGGPGGGSKRRIRGGSWNNSANHCTVSNRNNNPGNRNNNNGFRPARSSDQTVWMPRHSMGLNRPPPRSRPPREARQTTNPPRPAQVGPPEAVSKAPGGGTLPGVLSGRDIQMPCSPGMKPRALRRGPCRAGWRSRPRAGAGGVRARRG